jgi:head-tail adaptor
VRASKLDRLIEIETAATYLDEYGTPTDTWACIASLRAELIQDAATEYLFRTRFIDGITTAERVAYGELQLHVKQVKEIGRRRGLEIHAFEAVPK